MENLALLSTIYCKIPKISPGHYKIFSKSLFEGLIFGGVAHVWREICVSKSIGLACSGKEIYEFCFVLLCIRGQIPGTSPPGGLYSEGWFNGGFLSLRFWGAYIWSGLYMEELIFGILRYYLYHAMVKFQFKIILPAYVNSVLLIEH